MTLDNRLGLTDQVDDCALFMKGIDVIYDCESYNTFKTRGA